MVKYYIEYTNKEELIKEFPSHQAAATWLSEEGDRVARLVVLDTMEDEGA